MSLTQYATKPSQEQIEERVLKVLNEFTKSSPMGSITTGMLNMLIKPSCSQTEFDNILLEMQNRGLVIGIPKGKTRRWKLD